MRLFYSGFFAGIAFMLFIYLVMVYRMRPKKKKPSDLILKSDRATIRRYRHDFYLLAEWYCQLNSWNWPTQLLPSEPGPVKGKEYRYPNRRIQLCNYIESITGKRYISWYWNTQHRKDPDKMNQAQWEAWYYRNYETA